MKYDNTLIIKKMLSSGLIDSTTLKQACEESESLKINIIKAILRIAGITREQIIDFFNSEFGINTIHVSDLVLNRKIVALLPVDIATTHMIIPVFSINKNTALAVADPLDTTGIDKATKITGKNSLILISPKHEIIAAIDKFMLHNKKDLRRSKTDLNQQTRYQAKSL